MAGINFMELANRVSLPLVGSVDSRLVLAAAGAIVILVVITVIWWLRHRGAHSSIPAKDAFAASVSLRTSNLSADAVKKGLTEAEIEKIKAELRQKIRNG